MNNCTICKNEIIGYGNNAWPINDGQCCDKCNATHVIAIRLALMSVQHNPQEAKAMLEGEKALIAKLYDRGTAA